jgi:branched-chain amino acid transport system permease protein
MSVRADCWGAARCGLSTTRVLLIALGVIVLAAFLPLGVTGYILGLLTIAYYFGVFAMAWDLLFGFAGEVNFGPTFLIGTGAYTAGILDNLYQPPIWLCLVAGALAAVTGGVVLALPALRVRGPYFGLTTLVAVLMLQNFIVVDASLTGGEIGLTVPDVISISDTKNYEIALWFMAVSGAILFSLSRSPVGLILQASGQDAVQAGALGFNVTKHKLAAFIISAFFSGWPARCWCFISARPRSGPWSTSRSACRSSSPRCSAAAAPSSAPCSAPSSSSP